MNSKAMPAMKNISLSVNNKVKVIKRNAFGIRKFERFRNRILHIMTA
ncbi:MAG: transposase [Anaerovoracaceae bacterium]|jgi:transposase